MILHNQRSILTVCSRTEWDTEGRVTISLPRLISGEGVVGTIPLTLSDVETAALHRSVGVVKSASLQQS